MPIPEFQEFMLPVLTFLKDGKEHSSKELYSLAAEHFKLTEDDKNEWLPSKSELRYMNRTSWARTFLLKAGLIETPKRGFAKITPEGLKVLAQDPSRIDNKFLSQYPQFVEFRTSRKSIDDKATDQLSTSEKTPEELIEFGVTNLSAALSDELLNELLKSEPYHFEHIVAKF